MEFEIRGEFLEALEELVGPELRAVSVYDREGYEAVYLREDVDALYEPETFEDAHEGMILEGLGGDYLESLFAVGDLQCAVYGFEAAYIFHFFGDEYEGHVVSLDPDTEVPLGPFVDLCRAEFDDHA